MLSKSFTALRHFGGYKLRRHNAIRKAAYAIMNRDDVQSPYYKASTYNPVAPLEGHKPIYREDAPVNSVMSRLKNGIHVVTRSPAFPGHVDMGILIDVGTRDETAETSGSLLSIRNTYYKTVVNTNETVNYGMVQMSGGNFEMDYDQETQYWKANCFSHDAADIFRMMADCALEPRSVVAANVGIDKNKHSHKLDQILKTGEAFNDHIMRTAFGQKGLGMPLRGLPHNVNNLTAHTLQKFQMETIQPRKVYVCGAGIENHQEFLDLVESKLGHIPPIELDAIVQRQKTEYHGGEVRIPTDDADTHIALAFQSVNWNHQDLFAFQLLNRILGSTCDRKSRVKNNIGDKHAFVDSACGLNFNFTDAGLWGVQISGHAEKGTEMLQAVIGEIKGLANGITNDELVAAKLGLKSDIYRTLEKQGDMIEEGIRNVRTFGSLIVISDYAKFIDSVTTDQITSALSRILKSRPTLVVQGGEVGRLPSLDKIEGMLQ